MKKFVSKQLNHSPKHKGEKRNKIWKIELMCYVLIKILASLWSRSWPLLKFYILETQWKTCVSNCYYYLLSRINKSFIFINISIVGKFQKGIWCNSNVNIWTWSWSYEKCLRPVSTNLVWQLTRF